MQYLSFHFWKCSQDLGFPFTNNISWKDFICLVDRPNDHRVTLHAAQKYSPSPSRAEMKNFLRKWSIEFSKETWRISWRFVKYMTHFERIFKKVNIPQNFALITSPLFQHPGWRAGLLQRRIYCSRKAYFQQRFEYESKMQSWQEVFSTKGRGSV